MSFSRHCSVFSVVEKHFYFDFCHFVECSEEMMPFKGAVYRIQVIGLQEKLNVALYGTSGFYSMRFKAGSDITARLAGCSAASCLLAGRVNALNLLLLPAFPNCWPPPTANSGEQTDSMLTLTC